MKELLIVFAGGGSGAVFRYLINRMLGSLDTQFPYATLAANIIACLILGMVTGWLAFRSGSDQLLRLLFVTGFCGGLSTFSTFTVDTLELFKHGHGLSAITNIAGNLILCLLALNIGIYIAKSIFV